MEGLSCHLHHEQPQAVVAGRTAALFVNTWLDAAAVRQFDPQPCTLQTVSVALCIAKHHNIAIACLTASSRWF